MDIQPNAPAAIAANRLLAALEAGPPGADALRLDGAKLGRDALAARAERGAAPGAEGGAWWDAQVGGLKLAGLDLRSASLRGAELDGANLRGADMRGVKARSASFRGAHVEQTKLAGADLTGACFARAEGGEADLAEALLEDADFAGARFRYAQFGGAILDGAGFEDADLWGAGLEGVEADFVRFRNTHLDEASLEGARLTRADLDGASLRRANLRRACLAGANLRGARLEGAVLEGADLSGASLPFLVLTGIDLRGVRFAGAWLERTRLLPSQFGGMVGEEQVGEWDAAREAYVALEQNFRSLGNGDAASWAFRRGRRMRKLTLRDAARAALRGRHWGMAARDGTRWALDAFVEWLCDYGESLSRVARAFALVSVLFAALYGVTGSLSYHVRDDDPPSLVRKPLDLFTYSLINMTTAGSADIGIHPYAQPWFLIAGLQGATGTLLIGLFGFVLGNRMRG